MGTKMLWVRDWDYWQTYRKDRGAPPWIKLHTRLLWNSKWMALTAVQRGQLVIIWMIAAANGGSVPNNADYLKLAGNMESPPDLEFFQAAGFLMKRRQPVDATVTHQRQRQRQTQSQRSGIQGKTVVVLGRDRRGD